jgi:hypothetical protein
MAKFSQIKKIARQGRDEQHNIMKGIRKPMPPPSRPFADDDDDDSWKREVDEYQMEQQHPPQPQQGQS